MDLKPSKAQRESVNKANPFEINCLYTYIEQLKVQMTKNNKHIHIFLNHMHTNFFFVDSILIIQLVSGLLLQPRNLDLIL